MLSTWNKDVQHRSSVFDPPSSEGSWTAAKKAFTKDVFFFLKKKAYFHLNLTDLAQLLLIFFSSQILKLKTTA